MGQHFRKENYKYDRRPEASKPKQRDFIVPRFIQIIDEESERIMRHVALWHQEHGEMNISDAPRHKRLAQICRQKLTDYQQKVDYGQE